MTEGDPSLGSMFGRLLDDGKAYAHAELEVVRLKAEKKALSYRTAVLLGLGAAGLALTAATAFTLTLVLWLAKLLGPLGGGMLATAVVALLALGLALAARKSFEAANDE